MQKPTKIKTPKTITDLRDRLLQAFTDVEMDEKEIDRVREMTNAAGKILGTVKIQIVYSTLRNEMPDIEFLGDTSGRPALKSAKRQLHLLNESVAPSLEKTASS